MGVAEIKKFYLVSPQFQKEKILLTLADVGAAEILPLSNQQIQTISQKSHQELEIVSQAIEIARRYCSPKKYLSRLFISSKQREEILSEFRWQEVIAKIKDIERRIQETEAKFRLVFSQHQQLLPWAKIDISLKSFRTIKCSEVVASGINPVFQKEFFATLEKEIPASVCGEVSRDKNFSYCWVIYPRDCSEKWQKIRQKFSVQEFSFPEVNLSPQRLLRWQKLHLKKLQKQIEDLHKQLTVLSEENLNKLKVVYDYFYEQFQIIQTEQKFLKTSSSFAIQGYIVEKFVPKLERSLPETAVLLVTEPAPGEDLPTVLENKKIIEPFEVVTDLYGRPSYSELDPTPQLAPFFALFFGVCMADAIYGLILIIAGLIMQKKLLSSFGQRFSRLVFYCGIFATAFGVITGSWFSNLPQKAFPDLKIFSQLTLFDPLKNPALFLLLTIVFGLVQTIYGTILNIYNSLRNRDWPGLFLSALPTLGIQLSFPTVVVTFIFGVLPKSVGKFSLWLLGLSAILIMINQWRINKEIVLKLFQMVFSVYSAITGNSLADPLSYCRLFALNLSTALLGMAINEIGLLFSSVPLFGPVILGVVLICAHLINMLLGALGAYVHTSRLQYLEFFNKFFQGGGRPMKVYSIDKKYTLMA